MADLNSVNLTGRLTADPESRGQGGVTAMRLAVNGRKKNDQGEWVDSAGFFNVVCFGRQAEVALEHLAKGRRVCIEGRLSWREWEAQDGSKRQAVEVIAQNLIFIDSKVEGGHGAAAVQGNDLPVDGDPYAPRGQGGGRPAADDDIPF